MKYLATKIPGCVLVDLEPRGDERGFFARLFDRQEFVDRHMEADFPQINTSASPGQARCEGSIFKLRPMAKPNSSNASKARFSTWWSIFVRAPLPTATGSERNSRTPTAG